MILYFTQPSPDSSVRSVKVYMHLLLYTYSFHFTPEALCIWTWRLLAVFQPHIEAFVYAIHSIWNVLLLTSPEKHFLADPPPVPGLEDLS